MKMSDDFVYEKLSELSSLITNYPQVILRVDDNYRENKALQTLFAFVVVWLLAESKKDKEMAEKSLKKWAKDNRKLIGRVYESFRHYEETGNPIYSPSDD